MLELRQSTASQEIALGPFVDSTDGNTEKTALTILNTDIKIWVEGGTTLASKNSGGATHIANGRYYCVLDATDTATLGKMVVFIHVAGALAVRHEFMVRSGVYYDAFVIGTTDIAAALTKLLAAEYDTLSRSGNVLTLSNGAVQTFTGSGRTTT